MRHRLLLLLPTILLAACTASGAPEGSTQAATCPGPGRSVTRFGDLAVDDRLLCLTKRGESVKVHVTFRPGEPLIEYHEVAKEFPPLPDLTMIAIESKELQIAKHEGKTIDEARLAELQSILRLQAPKAEAREGAIQAARHAQHKQAYAMTADRLEPVFKSIEGLDLSISELLRSSAHGTATPAALENLLKLDGIAALTSNDPVRVYP